LSTGSTFLLHRHLVGDASGILCFHLAVTDFIVIIHLEVIGFTSGPGAVQLRVLWSCVHSLPFAFHSVHSLTASVGVCDLDLL